MKWLLAADTYDTKHEYDAMPIASAKSGAVQRSFHVMKLNSIFPIQIDPSKVKAKRE